MNKSWHRLASAFGLCCDLQLLHLRENKKTSKEDSAGNRLGAALSLWELHEWTQSQNTDTTAQTENVNLLTCGMVYGEIWYQIKTFCLCTPDETSQEGMQPCQRAGMFYSTSDES